MIYKATPDDAGCWIDGHTGHYGNQYLIRIALSRGWEGADAEVLADRYPDIDLDESEILYACADEAESWLNENVAPAGYLFGWHDGEFFLGSETSWEEIYF